jgi:FlaA1/EpsC-like NDP-sugar epimerase
MGRTFARTLQASIDLGVLAMAYTLGFLIRFDWTLPDFMIARLLTTLPVVMAFKYSALVAFGIPRFAWSYVGLREAIRIFAALLVASAVLILVRVLVGLTAVGDALHQPVFIPLGVVAIDFTLAFLGIVGVRALRRLRTERLTIARRRTTSSNNLVRTLIVGAGQAGLLVAREIASRPDLGITPVGFVDDDPLKRGTVVHGLAVLGNTTQIGEVCRQTNATQVLLAVPQAPGTVVRRILGDCEQCGVRTKVVPGLYEVVDGRVNLSRLRNVAIEDLLRRAPVSLDEGSIGDVLRDRTVLVSGAGGSIGSELCRQALRFAPRKLILVERAENNLFQIHRELIGTESTSKVVPMLADVSDVARLESIFAQYKPDVVLHAAAHKHVPLMEANPCEAIKNNVRGTRTLADVASAAGVKTFVLISTDKAVNPTSVMGATKRLAECYVQALSARSSTHFLAVRFGNVLGSAGSVVPIFREQIERGGPVTVTDPEMRRYFMTIPEASQLVLQAASMGKGGEIFVLDMGEPVKVLDLAEDLIRLSGYKAEDIEIVFTGLRPGEKLFEELSLDEERADRTKHSKIFIGKLRPLPYETLARNLDELATVALSGDEPGALRLLRSLVPEYRQPSEPPSMKQQRSSASAPITFDPFLGAAKAPAEG